MGLRAPELIIILIIVLFIFRPKNPPKLGKSLAQANKVEVSADIQRTIDEYIESTSMDPRSQECISRCNSFLTEFEWYTGRYGDREEANWNAMWNAVCGHDSVYCGDRYPRDMMSNICLQILERQ